MSIDVFTGSIFKSQHWFAPTFQVEAHRDFILWTINKFKELQAKQVNPDAAMINNDDAEAADKSSTSSSEPPLTAAEQEKREKEERARLAAERRAKIMEQMKSAQQNFMKSNAEMLASTSTSSPATTNGNASSSRETPLSMEWQGDEEAEAEGAVGYNSVACLGIERRVQQPEEQSFKCILCFEDCTVTKDGTTLVYSAFIQKSKVSWCSNIWS